MDKPEDHRHHRKCSEQEKKQYPIITSEQTITFTDKKRKREEIKNSTIGGF